MFFPHSSDNLLIKLILRSYPAPFSINEAAFCNGDAYMRILLYNPDNGVTRNFMPHLWMFLLQALTPAGHEVLLIDGNAQPMDEVGIAKYVREHNIELFWIAAMTRLIAKSYPMPN